MKKTVICMTAVMATMLASVSAASRSTVLIYKGDKKAYVTKMNSAELKSLYFLQICGEYRLFLCAEYGTYQQICKTRYIQFAINNDELKKRAVYDFKCQNCGKPFQAYGNNHRKYCSRKCYINERFGGMADERS